MTGATRHSGCLPSMPRNSVITVRVYGMNSEVKAFVADGAKERIVVLRPNTASARQCREGHLPADPLRVRLIRVELESGEVEVLITSLLDTKAYPYRAFAKLYALRWGIEELQAGKATPGIRIFQAEALGCYCRISTQDLCAEPDSYLRAPGPVAGCRYQHRRHGYRINFANALSKMEQLVRLFLETSPLDLCMAVIAAYGRCGSSCAPRTQVPERHEKSPSPRIPDAVSKNTVRLKFDIGINLNVDFLAIEEYFGKPISYWRAMARKESRLFDVLNLPIISICPIKKNDCLGSYGNARTVSVNWPLPLQRASSRTSDEGNSNYDRGTWHSGCLPSMPGTDPTSVTVYWAFCVRHDPRPPKSLNFVADGAKEQRWHVVLIAPTRHLCACNGD